MILMECTNTHTIDVHMHKIRGGFRYVDHWREPSKTEERENICTQRLESIGKRQQVIYILVRSLSCFFSLSNWQVNVSEWHKWQTEWAAHFWGGCKDIMMIVGIFTAIVIKSSSIHWKRSYDFTIFWEMLSRWFFPNYFWIESFRPNWPTCSLWSFGECKLVELID